MLGFCQFFLATTAVGETYQTVIRTFPDAEKPFLSSDLAVKAAKSKNKKGFSRSDKPRINQTAGLNSSCAFTNCLSPECGAYSNQLLDKKSMSSYSLKWGHGYK